MWPEAAGKPDQLPDDIDPDVLQISLNYSINLLTENGHILFKNIYSTI